MPTFFATTSKGLVEALGFELAELGITHQEKTGTGIYFESNWEDCYRINYCSRIASRILKPVLDFPAYNPDDLYYNTLKHDFTKYIDVNQTIKIEASVNNSALRDQRFLAMKIKDAICDQFREKFGERPNVDTVNPDLRVYVRMVKDQVQLAIDTSGDSLYMRGYRKHGGLAPMKENLAAGLLVLSGWDRKSPIVDPMCGSGTVVIEAALMALNIAPGAFRREFGFQRLKGYDEAAFDRVVENATAAEREEIDFQLFAYDIDRKTLTSAKENARLAGVDNVIVFRSGNVTTLTSPVEKGMIITNPPYGARVGDEDNLRDVYRDFSHTLKNQFKGWDTWILSGNKDLIADLKLKSSRKIFLYNGPLECRFLKYEIN